MDDLLDLFAEDESNSKNLTEASLIERTASLEGNSDENRRQDAPREKTDEEFSTRSMQQRRSQQRATAVDNQVGIRMINRKISSTDLLDMISESFYRSPASLGAMSLASLNSILVQPAAVIDSATLCGRTNILSVGLVFSNSGTRMSSSGNAFCVLTIGNMASGPAITVLCFGGAYSRNVRLAPGRVVAIVEPRLIPPKNGDSSFSRSSTSVTFTVNDEKQLRLVADARDFGVCKAKVAGKNEHGKWVANAKRCQRYVDLRTGEYCQAHRKQALTNSGDHVQGKGSLGHLRVQARAFPTALGNRPTHSLPLSDQLKGGKANKLQQKTRTMSLLSSKASVGSSLRCYSQIQTSQPSQTNSLLNAYTKKAAQPLNRRRPHPTKVTHKVSRTEPSSAQRVSGDWLQEASKPKSAATNRLSGRKRRTVNTDTTHFDGSVAVPRPTGRMMVKGMAALPRQRQQKQTQTTKQEVLHRQRQMATQLSGRSCTAPSVKEPKENQTTKSSTGAAVSKEDLLFGALGNIDMAKVLAAGSRFADEVDAEEYARARQQITELEKQEEKNEARESSRKKQASTGAIQNEWFCANCRHAFKSKPARCYSSGHKVRIWRHIQEAKSTTEKRLDLAEKQIGDGGMTLGQGIEWSRRSRFS